MSTNDRSAEQDHTRIPLPNSTRRPLPGAVWSREAEEEEIRIVVVVRRRLSVDRSPWPEPAKSKLSGRARSAARARPRHRPSLAEAGRWLGAETGDLEAVSTFFQQRGLTVHAVYPAFRYVVLKGPVSAVNEGFGVRLGYWKTAEVEYLSHAGPVQLPAALAGVVVRVLGLDTRPILRPMNNNPVTQATNPTVVAQVYQFPPGTGAGESIAIMEFGGGYRTSDLNQYWTALGLTNTPTVIPVTVSGPGNAPSNPPSGADKEVTGDITIASSVAPQATLLIVFCTNSVAAYAQGIAQATTSGVCAISISWGGLESSWDASDLQAVHEAFAVAAAAGITTLAGSGDTPGAVYYTATDPYVLACGGTSLATGNLPVATETVWPSSSGGTSAAFPLPIWQTAEASLMFNLTKTYPYTVTGRGVPDVAGYAAAPFYLGGNFVNPTGTSAVPPLYSGLIAILTELNGPVGHLNPLLYAMASPAVVRQAADAIDSPINPPDLSWNAFTGMGSLRAFNLLGGLTGSLRLGMVWKGITGDQSFYHSQLGQGMWSPQRTIYQAETSIAPAVDNLKIMVWKGAGDSQIYTASYGPTGWSPQAQLSGAKSSVSPTIQSGKVFWVGNDSQVFMTGAWSPGPGFPTGIYSSEAPAAAVLANVEPDFLLAWKGVGPDTQVYWRTYNDITGNWGGINPISGVWSSVRPVMSTLTVVTAGDPTQYQNTVYMVVVQDGPALLLQWVNGKWTTLGVIPGVVTQTSPGLAAYGTGLYLCWKDYFTQQVFWSVYDGTNWTFPREIPAIATSDSPALAATDAGLLLAWKGEAGDNKVYWANSGAFSGKQWGWQDTVKGFGTSTGAALATMDNGTVVMIWKGIEGDNRIWYAVRTGFAWSAQKTLQGAETSAAPACVFFNNQVLAVWRGADNDETIYSAQWTGSHWTTPAPIPGIGSSTSPALAVFQNGVFMAWKGITGDQSIWYSTWDGTAPWTPQAPVTGIGTSESPALAALNNNLLMAWKGIEGDQSLWYNQWDGNSFTSQSQIQYRGPSYDYTGKLDTINSSIGPALCLVGQVVYMVWKGPDSDLGIYSAIWDGVEWSYPVSAGSMGTSFRPALSLFPDS